ncbi:MAG: carboxypeptidase M32 [Thermomicrobiales bacterium]
MANETYEKLLARLQQVNDIQGAAGLLGWDQRTYMPVMGAATRAERLATLGGLAHSIFTDDETGALIEALGNYEASLPHDSNEASLIRHTRKAYRKAKVTPSDLAADMSRAKILGYSAWMKAKADGDFAKFLPSLERIVGLRRQQIALFKDAFSDIEDDYDILLDDFEPDLKASEVDSVFDRLKEATIPLIGVVNERSDLVHDDIVHGNFSVDEQKRLVQCVIEQLGFESSSWRLDETEHPFANPMAITDIRITNHYHADFFNPALFGTMHEFGHGLYERNVSTALDRTPLARGASMAWHESQSRMWENLVGRGRPFWDWATPLVQRYLPDAFDEVGPDDIYRAVNKLGPSLIRIEADELTYNLHIILRYELERDIFANRVALADLPEAWNEKMRTYFGIDVPNNSVGVLQDVHWGSGLFGYFPTYALGNVVALQLWQRITREIPNLDTQIRTGDFAPLREWLRSEIHQHGSKFTPKELLHKVLSVDRFDPEPLIGYLENKVKTLYGV